MKALCVLAWLLAATLSLHAQFTFTDQAFLAGATGAKAEEPAPQIPTPLIWLDADTEFSGTPDGTQISQWTDQSGHGNHFINLAGAGPFVTNNVINARTALRFASARFLTNYTGILSGVKTSEMVAVLRANESPLGSTTHVPWTFGSIGFQGDAAHPFTDQTINECIGTPRSFRTLITNANYWPSNWHSWNCATATNFNLARFNGDIVGGLDFVISTGFTNELKLGLSTANTLSWNGEMAEFLFWPRVLSNQEREDVHQYLGTKYGLSVTSTLPTYTPSDFPGLIGWWDATSLVGSNHGDFVGWWPDLSGYGNDWTNSGNGRSATFHENVFNARPALWFNRAATNHYILTTTDSILITNFFTTIVVHKVTNDYSNLFGRTASPFIQLRYAENGQNRMQLYNGTLSSLSADGPQPPKQLQMDVMQSLSTSRGSFWKNATNQILLSVVGGQKNLNVLGATYSGGAFPSTEPVTRYGGYIAEICVYTNFLQPDEILKLYYTYFRPKWGLP